MIARPTLTWSTNSSRESSTETGDRPSLSRVPPVWPRPRPLIFPNGTPQAATRGRRRGTPCPPHAARRVLARSTRRPISACRPIVSPPDHRVRERVGLAPVQASEVDGHAERQAGSSGFVPREIENELRELLVGELPPSRRWTALPDGSLICDGRVSGARGSAPRPGTPCRTTPPSSRHRSAAGASGKTNQPWTSIRPTREKWRPRDSAPFSALKVVAAVRARRGRRAPARGRARRRCHEAPARPKYAGNLGERSIEVRNVETAPRRRRRSRKSRPRIRGLARRRRALHAAGPRELHHSLRLIDRHNSGLQATRSASSPSPQPTSRTHCGLTSAIASKTTSRASCPSAEACALFEQLNRPSAYSSRTTAVVKRHGLDDRGSSVRGTLDRPPSHFVHRGADVTELPVVSRAARVRPST